MSSGRHQDVTKCDKDFCMKIFLAMTPAQQQAFLVQLPPLLAKNSSLSDAANPQRVAPGPG